MSQNGKGDKPRPKTVDQKTWAENYNRIFKHGNNRRSTKK